MSKVNFSSFSPSFKTPQKNNKSKTPSRKLTAKTPKKGCWLEDFRHHSCRASAYFYFSGASTMILGSDESKTIPLDYDIGRLFRQYDHAVFVFFLQKNFPYQCIIYVIYMLVY